MYYFVEVIELQNIFLLLLVLLSLISFAGILISKLSVEPLIQHVNNLQNLSKETLHELNLPISTIKTNIHMLKKNIKDEKDIKRTTRIESACDMLQQRYDELDYLIKLQSSDIINETFSLDELVRQRVEFLKPIYPHINFNIDLENTQIENDKVGLSKVIDNLIDNAVKYSSNSTDIDITLQDDELSIRDYGCGMDEVELL